MSPERVIRRTARVLLLDHTDLERECMVGHRWFTLSELPGWPETVYPAQLDSLVRQLRDRPTNERIA